MTAIEPDFVFEAGNLALDLANTSPRSGGREIEQLSTPAAVDAWVAAAGVAPTGTVTGLEARLRERLLVDAHALRAAVRELASALRDGDDVPDAALDVVNGLLATRTWIRRVVRVDGGFRRDEAPSPVEASALLAPVAEAAVELLVNGDPGRIRQCDDDACVLWFLDSTRNGSRRWCSMERCGNRAKSAAHYRRVRKKRRGGRDTD